MSGTSNSSLCLRAFSEGKHSRGRWDTAAPTARGGMLRGAWNYLSLKRSGVDRLACIPGDPSVVLDLGAGAAAYSIWFLSRHPCTMVAVDWSFTALCRAPKPRLGVLCRVCADVSCLPFRSEVFARAFSIDTLGHVPRPEGALDELLRVCRAGAHLFLHSECSDYRRRWPDRALMKKLGTDAPAIDDGHVGLRPSADIRRSYTARFALESFRSPAGLLGWLLGYPEKYRGAFAKARWRTLACLTAIFAWIKAMPLLGGLLRLVNASTNHLELFLGISGGGSCFAVLRKHDSTPRTPGPACEDPARDL